MSDPTREELRGLLRRYRYGVAIDPAFVEWAIRYPIKEVRRDGPAWWLIPSFDAWRASPNALDQVVDATVQALGYQTDEIASASDDVKALQVQRLELIAELTVARLRLSASTGRHESKRLLDARREHVLGLLEEIGRLDGKLAETGNGRAVSPTLERTRRAAVQARRFFSGEQVAWDPRYFMLLRTLIDEMEHGQDGSAERASELLLSLYRELENARRLVGESKGRSVIVTLPLELSATKLELSAQEKTIRIDMISSIEHEPVSIFLDVSLDEAFMISEGLRQRVADKSRAYSQVEHNGGTLYRIVMPLRDDTKPLHMTQGRLFTIALWCLEEGERETKTSTPINEIAKLAVQILTSYRAPKHDDVVRLVTLAQEITITDAG